MYFSKYLKYKNKYLEHGFKYKLHKGGTPPPPSLFNEPTLTLTDFLKYLKTVDLRTKDDIEKYLIEDINKHRNASVADIILIKLLLCFTSKKCMQENIHANSDGGYFITNVEHCFKPLFYDELQKLYENNELSTYNTLLVQAFTTHNINILCVNDFIKMEFGTLNDQNNTSKVLTDLASLSDPNDSTNKINSFATSANEQVTDLTDWVSSVGSNNSINKINSLVSTSVINKWNNIKPKVGPPCKQLGKGRQGIIYECPKIMKVLSHEENSNNDLNIDAAIYKNFSDNKCGPVIENIWDDGIEYGYTMEKYDSDLKTFLIECDISLSTMQKIEDAVIELINKMITDEKIEYICFDQKFQNILIRKINDNKYELILNDFDSIHCQKKDKLRDIITSVYNNDKLLFQHALTFLIYMTFWLESCSINKKRVDAYYENKQYKFKKSFNTGFFNNVFFNNNGLVRIPQENNNKEYRFDEINSMQKNFSNLKAPNKGLVSDANNIHQIKYYIGIWLDIIFNNPLRKPLEISLAVALKDISPNYIDEFIKILDIYYNTV